MENDLTERYKEVEAEFQKYKDSHGIKRTIRIVREAKEGYEKVLTQRSLDKTNLATYMKIHNQKQEACKKCPSHPDNGGSGICNCTLGSMDIVEKFLS